MPLTKKPEMTPEKIAANQANAHLSNGPATPEGMERLREARTTHGFYSQAEGEALRALGEDPDGFAVALKDVMTFWQPTSSYEARLVKRLARALWKCERDDRWQESVAVRQLQNLDANVARHIREAEARFKQAQATLKVLVDALKKEDFCTGFDEILAFADVFGDEPKGRLLEMETLLYRLLKPGTPVHGKAPADYQGPEAQQGLPLAEDHHRPAVRRELRERLEEEMEARKVAHAQELKEFEYTTNPYYRDTLLAPTHPQAQLMLRSEDSNFRKVERLTTILMKLKAKTPPAGAGAYSQNEGKSHDVDENKGP
ncbi:MAG: hypothetical protein ACLQOO_07410 [Terriglobia bacterium]